MKFNFNNYINININIFHKEVLVMNRSYLFIVILLSFNLAFADSYVGHSASHISGASFGTGNFTFPNSLIVDGNVGVGTSDPQSVLDVNGHSVLDTLSINSRGYITWNGGAGNTFNIISTGGNALSFGSDGTYDRLYVDTNGNVGIGTTNPTSKLDLVDGNLKVRSSNNTHGFIAINRGSADSTGYIDFFRGSASPYRLAYLGYKDGGSTNLGLNLENGANFVINGGNVGIGTTNSGDKLTISNGSISIDLNQKLKFNGVNDFSWNIGVDLNAINGQGALRMKGYGSPGNPRFISLASTNGSTIIDRLIVNTESGNVGIGTTDPKNKLQIGSTGISGYAGNQFVIGDGTHVLSNYLTSTAATFYSNYDFSFMPSGSGALGHVGIGTTSPSEILHIQKDSNTNQNLILLHNGNAGNLGITSGASIAFRGRPWGGSADNLLAAIQFEAKGSQDDGYIYFRTARNINLAGALQTQMTVDPDGKIGIGTTDPLSKLQIDAGYPLVRSHDNVLGSSGILIGSSINQGTYSSLGVSIRTITESADENSYGLQLFTMNSYLTGQTEKMRISADGKVGIGTINPLEKLSISNGNIFMGHNLTNQIESGRIRFSEYNTNYLGGYVHYDGLSDYLNIGVHNIADTSTSNDVNAIRISRSSQQVLLPTVYGDTSSGGIALYINSAGLLGTSTSSIRYKTNVTDIVNTDKIFDLRPVDFNWKEDGTKDFGLIAEEVEQVYPELVFYNVNGTIQGVKYEKIIIPVLKQVQELKEQNYMLKQELCTKDNYSWCN